jgi:hypothetical protein
MSSGYVDFPTLPAGAGSTSVPGLGTFSTLAGPVVGADGTVYLASLEGKVIALRDDDQPYWTAQIDPRLGMSSPPAIGIEGSAYVMGSTRWVDHRTGREGPGGRGMLYRFLREWEPSGSSFRCTKTAEPGSTAPRRSTCSVRCSASTTAR